MIRGMSYPKGVFFMDKKHIAHATIAKDGKIATQLFPLDSRGLLFFVNRMVLSIPLYFGFIWLAVAGWVFFQPTMPVYLILLISFGYHFIFPHSLKQYHGAEHKVFSYRRKKSLDAIEQVRRADIVNRHCSTNFVVTFFIVFLLSWAPLGGNKAALLGLFATWAIPRFFKTVDQKWIFPISAFLQRRLTTTEPETRHIKAALLSYISLIRKKAVDEETLLEEERMERAKRFLIEREQRILETEYIEI